MRIVFMGTPEIAATCLARILSADLSVVGVYTKPDMPKNRGMKLAMSPVKELALAHGLPVFQPVSLKDPSVLEQLRQLRPDVISVVAYGKILPPQILALAPCINIHASILPQLRGSGPVQWAILNGLEETGVTAMYMEQTLDTGDIIEICRTPIAPEENAQQLMDRLAELGADLLRRVLERLRNGEKLPRIPQDDTKATYAPMLTKALSAIDWNQPGRQICNQVRGLDPWPVASCQLFGKRFKIYQVSFEPVPSGQTPGTVLALTKQGLVIACGDGEITVLQLQAEGGKRMRAADYFRGHPVQLDTKF